MPFPASSSALPLVLVALVLNSLSAGIFRQGDPFPSEDPSPGQSFAWVNQYVLLTSTFKFALLLLLSTRLCGAQVTTPGSALLFIQGRGSTRLHVLQAALNLMLLLVHSAVLVLLSVGRTSALLGMTHVLLLGAKTQRRLVGDELARSPRALELLACVLIGAASLVPVVLDENAAERSVRDWVVIALLPLVLAVRDLTRIWIKQRDGEMAWSYFMASLSLTAAFALIPAFLSTVLAADLAPSGAGVSVPTKLWVAGVCSVLIFAADSIFVASMHYLDIVHVAIVRSSSVSIAAVTGLVINNDRIDHPLRMSLIAVFVGTGVLCADQWQVRVRAETPVIIPVEQSSPQPDTACV